MLSVGESDEARRLRSRFVFKVVPMLNPDGVILGNYRTGLAGYTHLAHGPARFIQLGREQILDCCCANMSRRFIQIFSFCLVSSCLAPKPCLV